MFIFYAPSLLHLLWLCFGAVLVRPLGSSVLLCGSQLWPGLCNTPITFHPQLTQQNIDYTNTHATDYCACFNHGSFSPECVFIADYSCVLWSAPACGAQLLVTGTEWDAAIYTSSFPCLCVLNPSFYYLNITYFLVIVNFCGLCFSWRRCVVFQPAVKRPSLMQQLEKRRWRSRRSKRRKNWRRWWRAWKRRLVACNRTKRCVFLYISLLAS